MKYEILTDILFELLSKRKVTARYLAEKLPSVRFIVISIFWRFRCPCRSSGEETAEFLFPIPISCPSTL